MSASDLVEIEVKKHYDESDCIGCSPPPRLVRQKAVVGEELEPVLECSEEFASQSQESLDASSSPQLSEDEDEEMAMAVDPDEMYEISNPKDIKAVKKIFEQGIVP